MRIFFVQFFFYPNSERPMLIRYGWFFHLSIFCSIRTIIIIIMIIIFKVIFSFLPSKCTFALSLRCHLFARYMLSFSVCFFSLSIVYIERWTTWMIHQTKSTIEDRIHQSSTELLISIFCCMLLFAHNTQKRCCCWCTLLMLNVFEIKRIVLKQKKNVFGLTSKHIIWLEISYQISPKALAIDTAVSYTHLTLPTKRIV